MNIASQRLHNQRLVGTPFADPVEAVRWFGAVQSQDYLGAKWALALRTAGFDNAAIDRLFDAGDLLRTHVLRPTWHFVAPEDLRWLLALTGPRVHQFNAHYYRKWEMDEVNIPQALDIFTKALEGRQYLTRRELATRLAEGGIEAAGPRLAHFVMYAELEGLLCSGPLRGKQFTYALLEERVPPAPVQAREEALARLMHRYFTSHSPATVHDASWWSGLTVADVRSGLELIKDEVDSVVIDEKTYWLAAPAPAVEIETPVAHLLPAFDEHTVAYKDHGPSLDPAARIVLQNSPPGMLDYHFVARDGLIVGGWRRAVRKKSAVVNPNLLIPLSEAEQMGLKRAAEDYGRFMGMPVVVEEDGG